MEARLPAWAQRLLARMPAPDLLGAAAAGVAVVAPALLSGDELVGSGTDLVSMEAPLAAFGARWLRQGVFPLWNPFIAGGVPLPGATAGYLSPVFWASLLLPGGPGIRARIALSLAIAGAGGAWLCRPHVRSRLASFLGGALFAASGFLSAHLYAGHLELVAAAALLPWMVGVVDRIRRGASGAWAPAAACFALAWLAAHYQMVALGGVAAGLLVVASGLLEPGAARARALGVARALAALGGLAALGAVVAAVQVLPLAEVLPYTQRQAPGPGFAASYPAAPASLVGLLLPGLMAPDAGLPFSGELLSWEACGYVGVVTLALAAYAATSLPRARWAPAGAGAAVAALLALGDRTPLLRALCAALPPLGRFRAAGRYLVVFSLFAALLAALGLDALLSPAAGARRGRPLSGPAVLAAAGAALAVALATLPQGALTWAISALAPVDLAAAAPRWAGMLDRLRADAVVSALLLGVALGALAAGARAERRTGAAWALALLAVIDPLRAGWPLLRTAPRARLEWITPLVDHLREALGPGGRMMPTPELAAPNLGAPYDLASPTGYSIFLDARYARYANRAAGRDLEAFATVVQCDGASPLLRHLGVGLVLTTAPPDGPVRRARLGMGDYHLVGGTSRVEVLAADAPVPRVVLVHAVDVVADERDAYARLSDPAFDLRERALVESPPTFPLGLAPGAHEQAAIAAYEPNVVTLQVEAAAAGLLVLSDVYEPGWTALVDGAPAPAGPVNRIMRGVPVPAGRHEVVMRYRPPGLQAGLWLSGLGLLVLGIMAGLDLRRRARMVTRP